ncbi:unnamed protein product [Ceratitis capitata]|uniref:(Mediterranean fruit fly) hypothetical protein n=1 Tax=Ceratitis capitata TaxID=7213 RepID=A0A811UB48_CERCA|nr:unnamed protein product [Ceratitis capitata]
MFSGLTNQFTSLVGAVKGGQADEDVPAPTQDAVGASEVPAAAAAPASTASAEQVANAAGVGGEQLLEGEEGAKSTAAPNHIFPFMLFDIYKLSWMIGLISFTAKSATNNNTAS